MKRRRVAIVTPWYGKECKGGAELQAAALAEQLSKSTDVTVLTTTSRSFLHSWDHDYHNPGKTRSGSYDVIRFKVRPRSHDPFNQANRELLEMPYDRWPEICAKRSRFEPFIDESINSPDLENHLKRRGRALYDAVLFLPFLYGIVIRGIEAYPGPAHFIPCLHDEAYARVPRIEDAFHKAGTLLFNSRGEAELALRLYGPGILAKSHVVGEGIIAPEDVAASIPVDGPYFLCVGRRAREKGVDALVDVFSRRRSNGHPSEASLVLVGPGDRSYNDPDAGIYDLGFVDEPLKAALMRNAVALLNPSLSESYSRVLMESWQAGIPVVAHKDCLATATAVREAGGGFVAGTADEWVTVLAQLETMDEAARKALGERGAGYAAEHANWDNAIARLRSAIGFDAPAVARRNGMRIDQILEGVDNGDAVSDYARYIRTRLHELGFESTIYAMNIPPWVSDVRQLQGRIPSDADGIIYHHSIGSNAVDIVLAATCRKAMIYHNMTPAHYFAKYAPEVVQQLEIGRAQLAKLSSGFNIYVADSEYNDIELRDGGFPTARTIPVVTNFRLDCSPNGGALHLSGRTTWLFVGRASPNKGLRALIDAFEAYLTLDEDAHLVVVGRPSIGGDAHFRELQTYLAQRRLNPFVTFTGYADEPTLVAHYRSADVFVCMSEHEGFCVPLVESMFFDLPIVAKATSAIPGTLGKAGLLLEPDADALEVAAAVHAVCSDQTLREQIIAAQRERRLAFLPAQITPLIDALITDLIAQSA